MYLSLYEPLNKVVHKLKGSLQFILVYSYFVPGSSVSQSPKFKVDYNLLIENIKDLNTLAGEGVASIKHTKDGARLKVR